MKPKKTEGARVTRKPDAGPAGNWRWPVMAAIAAALVAVLWAYAPAFHAPFLFDDNTLLFTLPSVSAPLADWLNKIRPVLMLSYWLNIQISGSDTFSYHMLNVLIHAIASGLMYFVVRRLLEWAAVEQRTATALAGFCALLFLLHPVQTEAVAYLSGRSEALSSLFFFAAFAVFLYRKSARVTWGTSAAVIVLFLAALASKEQTIVLPALLLLTDYWWNPGFSFRGIGENWKLYAPLALGAVAGLARFAPLIFNASSAGFGMKDLTWYQYLFTEFRAIFIYIREFFLPFGLNADWDFPFSRTIFDYGAIAGLFVLLALIAAAWHYRRRFPLASYGFFAFLILLSPTSSILPIRDPIAERRLYFAMFGLLLVSADVLRRVKLSRSILTAACAAILLLAAVATHARAEVWSSELTLWQDSEAKSPDKPRDHFQLAYAYLNANDCVRAEWNRMESSNGMEWNGMEWNGMEWKYKPDGYSLYNLLVDWGQALDCAGQPEPALAKFREAAASEQTAHVYTQIAKVYGERQQWSEAMSALDQAERVDPSFAATFAYRAIVYLNTGRCAEAVSEYGRAIGLDPQLEPTVREGLAKARQCMAAQRPAPAAGH